MVPIITRLKQRRDAIQKQLDQWIGRGFRGGGTGHSDDASQKETAQKVADVADLSRTIAREEAKKSDA